MRLRKRELLYMKFGCLRFIFFFLQCVVKMDGTHIKAIDSVGDPPLPIPNREVKPDSADGTANVCGRVGHRHFYKKRASVTEALFSCIYAVTPPLVYSGPMVLQTCVWECYSHFYKKDISKGCPFFAYIGADNLLSWLWRPRFPVAPHAASLSAVLRVTN